MLTAAGSSLVAGGNAQAGKTIQVRALRAFLVKGQRVEVGTVIEIARPVGMELVSSNKAELVAAAAPAAEAPAPAPARAARAPAAPRHETKGQP